MSRSNITLDEWLSELQRLSARSDEGFTAEEWGEKLGLSVRVVREKLAAAQAKGWLRLGWRTGVRLDGRGRRTPVYQIVRTSKGGHMTNKNGRSK